MPKFSLRQLIVLVALFAMLGGLYVVSKRTPLIGLYGSRRNLEIVRSPTRIEVYRLGEPPGGMPTGPKPVVSPLDYPVAAGPVVVPGPVLEIVGPTLALETTYNWDYPRLCDQPIYEIKLSVYRESERIDLYLSFVCDLITVARDGKIFGSEDFDGQLLVEITKGAFPGWEYTRLPPDFLDGR